MRYRVRKPRFAPPNSNGAVVHFTYSCYTLCGVSQFIYKLTQRRGYPPHPHIRVDSEPPVSVLDASLCVQARSLSLLYESTSSHHKETIILIRKISVLWLFYCKIRVFCPFSLIFQQKCRLAGIVFILASLFCFSRKI